MQRFEVSMKRLFASVFALIFGLSATYGQDSVDVTFRYQRIGSPTVYLVGEFNGWNNAAWPMTFNGTDTWTRTVRLPLGGNPTPPSVGVPGAWQYKFYYSGVSDWPNDPLNWHVNPRDNNNTFIYTKDPTIYQLQPNQRQTVVTTNTPTISAYIFPKIGALVDSSTITVTIDGVDQTAPPSAFSGTSNLFSWTLPVPLVNGSHTLILTAHSTEGGVNADTVTFATQSGYVRFTTQSGYETRNPVRLLRGLVQDTSVHSVTVVRNGDDTIQVACTAGAFSLTDTLHEGTNEYRAVADSAGSLKVSDPASFTLLVNHTPNAVISIGEAGDSFELLAAESTDPDSGQTATLSFLWSEDPGNPSVLGGINGKTTISVTVPKPSVPGDYFFGLIAKDVDGNADTTRTEVNVDPDKNITPTIYRSSPDWARTGRIYFLFPKAMSQAGTINEAAKRLQYIHDMGFSIIWMMPVMKNAYPINNGIGPGYNIVDFYNVAPEYGTNADFKSFVDQAHALGMKVILDVTPNHSSRSHPWSVDAHTYGVDSRYWSWYEHKMITANTNGLGDCLDASGFNYYCGFSDQLLNFNWNDPDMRAEMIDVYKYWVQQFGVDGFRFDVYWGPHRRYGEQAMGIPVRTALRHIKPDIFLLGEDDGTGTGTETIYADYNGAVPGGLDASYDFKLYFNQLENFYSGNTVPDAYTKLHNEIDNGGFYPGPDALYMRFLESQDQDRIAYLYSNSGALDSVTSYRRTMPVASVLFTIPGVPMLWNGQEVGAGYGVPGSKEDRDRSIINWNLAGAQLLMPHYQKLASIRGQFPAFTQHKRDTNGDGSVTSADSSDFIRVASSSNLAYAFCRPYKNQNGLAVVNVADNPISTSLDLSTAQLKFDGTPDSVYANELYGDTHIRIARASLNAFPVSLPAYGTAIYTISTTLDTLHLVQLPTSVRAVSPTPEAYKLEQNYPNPFNPSTTIQYTVGGTRGQGLGASEVRMVIYDVLGREVATLVNARQSPGTYEVRFDGLHLSSGIYFYRLTAGAFAATRAMLLLK